MPVKNGLSFLVDEEARTGRKLAAQLTNGIPSSKTTRVDESHALVAQPTEDAELEQVIAGSADVIDISSAEEDSEYEDSEAGVLDNGVNGANGHVEADGEEAVNSGAEDDRMEDVRGELILATEEVPEPEEPSFGDMLQARHPQQIDVSAAFPDPMAERSALIPASGAMLGLPSGTTLATALTQALKTNDKEQLERCFQTTDLPSIRQTIQRLRSQDACTLLQRLAERIHKRPGRTGPLMSWVQWSLVAHGGYIATQPEAMKRLKSLSQVVRERAKGLQPLLHLKGKLDMLTSQLELRKSVQAASRAANAEDEDDEEGVMYIEGAEESSSDEDAEDMQDANDAAEIRLIGAPKAGKTKAQTATPQSDVSSDEIVVDRLNDKPVNGFDHESSDDDNEGSEDGEGMLDLEAEESGEDNDDAASTDDDSDSAPESDNDTDISEDESEAEIKQPAPKTLNRKR